MSVLAARCSARCAHRRLAVERAEATQRRAGDGHASTRCRSRTRCRWTSGSRRASSQAQGIEINKTDAAERQRHRPRAREQQRRHRLPRLRADDDRAHAGHPVHARRGERGRGDVGRRQLAEHPGQGRRARSGRRRTSPGKTIAVNALKGVGEVMIKAALKKRGVDPNSVKLLALPFPAMRAALENGQVDAVWTPEPFLSQALNLDGARIVMAPGPGARHGTGRSAATARSTSWITANPALAAKLPDGDQPVARRTRRRNPNEIRDAAPGRRRGTCGCRSGARSIDRDEARRSSRSYTKEYGVISTLPNLDRAGAEHVDGRQEPAGDGRQPVHRAAARRRRA